VRFNLGAAWFVNSDAPDKATFGRTARSRSLRRTSAARRFTSASATRSRFMTSNPISAAIHCGINRRLGKTKSTPVQTSPAPAAYLKSAKTLAVQQQLASRLWRVLRSPYGHFTAFTDAVGMLLVDPACRATTRNPSWCRTQAAMDPGSWPGMTDISPFGLTKPCHCGLRPAIHRGAARRLLWIPGRGPG
jgi:hypothetical protein